MMTAERVEVLWDHVTCESFQPASTTSPRRDLPRQAADLANICESTPALTQQQLTALTPPNILFLVRSGEGAI
jgi:hypothetical protein